MTAIENQQRLDTQVETWLFAILRFAVTLRDGDRTAALTLARILDTSGVDDSSRFSFFGRTSARVCTAIADRRAPESEAVLRQHLARIGAPRLAQAFAAANGLDHGPGRRASGPTSRRANLWRGLDEPRRSA